MKNIKASLILKIIYVLFSLYWMFRYFYLKASYIFLIMGLFFISTSLYLLNKEVKIIKHRKRKN